MSANNLLVIGKVNEKFVLREFDVDCGPNKEAIAEFDTLEEAVRSANEYMSENEVEYGLDIRI
jgi:hypothetical protein